MASTLGKWDTASKHPRLWDSLTEMMVKHLRTFRRKKKNLKMFGNWIIFFLDHFFKDKEYIIKFKVKIHQRISFSLSVMSDSVIPRTVATRLL